MKAKRNSSLLAVFVSALIALALIPAIAVADPGGGLTLGTMDAYDLKIGTTEVSASGPVTDDAITEGMVTYDADTHILTLNDATISISMESGVAVSSALDELTIQGSGTISGYRGIQCTGCDLTVNGTGSGITIDSVNWGIASDHSGYNAVDGTLVLSGKVTATSANVSAIYAYDDLTIADNSTITATSNAESAGNGYSSGGAECNDGIFSTVGDVMIKGGTVTASGYDAGIGAGAYVASNGQGNLEIQRGTVTATGHNYGMFFRGDIEIEAGTVSAEATTSDGYHYPGGVALYAGGIIDVGEGVTKVSATASAEEEYSTEDPTYAMSATSLGDGLQFTKPSGGYIGGVNFGGPRNPDGTCAKTVVIEPANATTVLVPDEAVTSNLWYTGEEQTALSNSSTLPDANDPVNHSLWDGFEWKGVTSATDAGTYTAIAHLTGDKTWSDGTTADREYQWTIQPSEIKTDNSGNPSFYGTIYTQIYTGAAITPSLPGASAYVYKNYVEQDGGICYGKNNSYSDKFITGLTAGKDYNITSYGNNVNVGDNTATATVRFNAGNLTGEDMQLKFSIKEGVELPVGKTLAYTGKEQVGVVLDAGAQFTDENYKATDPGDYGTWVKRTDGKYWIVHEDGGGTHGSVSYRIWWKISDATPAPSPTKIAVPTGKTLAYNGKAQTGVASGEGYTLSGTTQATNAGSYTATATLQSGYAWSDGSTAAKKVSWKIASVASTVTLADKTVTYSGSAVASNSAKVTGSTGKVSYAYYSDAKCTKSVKAADVKNAGTYYVKATVAADANHKTATSGAAKITINKAANKLSAKAKTTKKKPLSAKRGKEATFALSKYAAVTNPAKGTLFYKRASGNAKIKVNAKNGKITVAKGLAKGAYTVKVKVTSAATTNYKSANKTVALYVKVK